MASIEDKGVMKYESVLPADFDGVFRFTNWSDEEFVGIWGKREYHFPANTRSPMIMPEHSPLEIQQIRKKFAKDLAEREFFKSAQYDRMRKVEGDKDEYGLVQPRLNSYQQAGSYTLDMIAPYIQRALEPLPIAQAEVRVSSETKIEEKLSRNDDGDLNTEAIDGKKSLRKKALAAE